ncbi:uncharacterized protein BXZ73DRAFT_77134 [Epithele typhae]|uniref:uncharacterized protein n=1 Tax=Epithele typhae TaxID=378194 RepID=UPI0020075E08|nr:uncharacterized protein BXZ73DRAFT_77134 [Epithele typhae]KAH9934041.1 hypothetical protein BXZ73DRAFT_77134 [Epithele typhae]
MCSEGRTTLKMWPSYVLVQTSNHCNICFIAFPHIYRAQIVSFILIGGGLKIEYGAHFKYKRVQKGIEGNGGERRAGRRDSELAVGGSAGEDAAARSVGRYWGHQGGAAARGKALTGAAKIGADKRHPGAFCASAKNKPSRTEVPLKNSGCGVEGVQHRSRGAVIHPWHKDTHYYICLFHCELEPCVGNGGTGAKRLSIVAGGKVSYDIFGDIQRDTGTGPVGVDGRHSGERVCIKWPVHIVAFTRRIASSRNARGVAHRRCVDERYLDRHGTNGSSTIDFHSSTSNPSPHTLQRTAALSEIMRGIPTVPIAVPSHTGVPSLSELHRTGDLEISMHKSTNACFLAVLCALADGANGALHDRRVVDRGDRGARPRAPMRPLGPDVAAALGDAVEALVWALPHFVWATKVEVEITDEGELILWEGVLSGGVAVRVRMLSAFATASRGSDLSNTEYVQRTTIDARLNTNTNRFRGSGRRLGQPLLQTFFHLQLYPVPSVELERQPFASCSALRLPYIFRKPLREPRSAVFFKPLVDRTAGAEVLNPRIRIRRVDTVNGPVHLFLNEPCSSVWRGQELPVPEVLAPGCLLEPPWRTSARSRPHAGWTGNTRPRVTRTRGSDPGSGELAPTQARDRARLDALVVSDCDDLSEALGVDVPRSTAVRNDNRTPSPRGAKWATWVGRKPWMKSILNAGAGRCSQCDACQSGVEAKARRDLNLLNLSWSILASAISAGVVVRHLGSGDEMGLISSAILWISVGPVRCEHTEEKEKSRMSRGARQLGKGGKEAQLTTLNEYSITMAPWSNPPRSRSSPSGRASELERLCSEFRAVRDVDENRGSAARCRRVRGGMRSGGIRLRGRDADKKHGEKRVHPARPPSAQNSGTGGRALRVGRGEPPEEIAEA